VRRQPAGADDQGWVRVGIVHPVGRRSKRVLDTGRPAFAVEPDSRCTAEGVDDEGFACSAVRVRNRLLVIRDVLPDESPELIVLVGDCWPARKGG
jgi:hypothetical protein